MPGTIQVSVLDFKGLHSSSPSSQILVKVSLGKREYQTWDKGEFTFPLTTLRDSLIITIQDDEGNQISHAGVETRLVVEKGVWDDIFSLEGGGHVHMKLQFVLSEEERQRIRIMRESAMKKKQDELCGSGHWSPKSASVNYNEVSGSQESFIQSGLVANEASLVSVPLKFFKDAKFDTDNRDRSFSTQKQKRTDTSDRVEKESNSSINSLSHVSNVQEMEKANNSKGKGPAGKAHSNVSNVQEMEKANNSKGKGPAGKAHSNVKKMISAFEGSLNQDTKPSIKPPPKMSQTRTEKDSFLANSHLNEVETEKVTSPKVTLERINAKELQQTKTCIREKVQTAGYQTASSDETKQLKEATTAYIHSERKFLDFRTNFNVKQNGMNNEKEYSKDFSRTSITEKPAFSRRMLDKHSKGSQSWNLFNKHSNRNLLKKKSEDKAFQKDTEEAEVISNGEPKLVDIWGDDHCSTGSSGLWIFPGEAKGFCITTAGKHIINLVGGFWDETNTHQRKLSACVLKNAGEVTIDAGTNTRGNEDGKNSSQKLRPTRENSTRAEESIGPFGQVIRVGIMVGFATLVLLTRKRTHRS